MVLVAPDDVQYDSTNDPLGLVKYTQYQFDNGSFGNGPARVFYHGDTVFFSNADQRWSGTAPGLADVYIKNQ